MSPQPTLMSQLLKWSLTTCLALFFTAELGAVAPKAAVVTKVDFSFAGLTNAGPVVGDYHSYLVKWTDNSLDEEGFEVQLKVGTDPFRTFSRVNANVTQAAIIGVNALAAGTDVMFQIVAWKFNGARIESTASAPFTFKIPAETANATLTAPTNLQATNVDDSRVKLTWKDNTNSEIYYQIDLKEASASAFSALTFANHSSTSTTENTYRLRLVPNTDYNFRVRATRIENVNATQPNASPYNPNTVTLRTPPLSPPTNFSASTISEKLIRLRWLDNSTNETGYEIQYRELGSSDAFETLGTLGENTSFVDVPVPQGSSLEWKVMAIYQYTPTGSTTSTIVRSAPSDVVIYSTSFPPPTNLQASMTGLANTVDLTWEDNSNTEFGFNIYTRRAGTENWYFARAVRENVEKVSVSSRTESNDSTTGKPIFIPLEAGENHEFTVRAVASNEANMSMDSNVATAMARHGFTGRLYHQAQQNVTLTRVEGTDVLPGYKVTTTNANNRTDWSVTNLPPGLSFDSGTGLITGTPSEGGTYNCIMTAQFTDSPTVNATLVLRVLRAPATPYIVRNIPATTIGIGTSGSYRVSLGDRFGDLDAETSVRLETSLKDNVGQPRVIDIHLYPSLAPLAVANFLSYVNAGDYNGMAFHRLVSGFVLQGGSLRPVAAPRSFASIPARPPVINEPGLSNVRGTISAAKVGARSSEATITTSGGSTTTVAKDDTFGYLGNPDSATTDFFISLADNSENLDNQNGGFTVFGRVSTSGMTVVDSIASFPTGSYQNGNTTSNYDSSLDKRILLDGTLTPFSGIPMTTTPAPTDMDISKTIRITKATVTSPMRFIINNPSPEALSAVVEGNDLKLTGIDPGPTGTKTVEITVIAADLDNRNTSQKFNVTVQKGHKPPVITKHPVSLAINAGSKATFSVTASGTNITYQWRRKVGAGAALNITGANKSTYTILSTQASDAATYDVVVSNGNANAAIASAPARLDLRTAPTVGQISMSKVVDVGQPLTLTVNDVTGFPAPTFAWKRGTTGVSGQKAATLNIPAAKLTDAGVYTATASNVVSKVTTAEGVNVFVVNKAVTRQFSTTGKTISLTAPVAGPGLLYRWWRNGVEIPINTERFSGIDTAVLKITASALTDTGSYTCLATMPGGLGNTMTGAIELFVVQRPVLPALTGVNAPPDAYIGVDYSWKLPYSTLASVTPSSFSVSGLPTGLKLNTTTGVISGRPTKIGIFRLSATASNVAGASTPTSIGDLRVAPLPYSNIGTFAGTISPAQNLNQLRGGRFDLTVLDTGSYTAKIILGTETISTAGALGIGTSLSGSGSYTYQSSVTAKRKDKSTITLLFELDPDLGYINGVVTNGTENAFISGFRQFWHETLRPCGYSSISGPMAYNMALNLKDDDVLNNNIPQGSGYLGMSVSTKGIGTISGRLADGTAITSSSMIGPQGEALLFLMLYKNTGSVLGQINIGDSLLGPSSAYARRVDGGIRWIKSVQPASERNYQPGIPETTLNVIGSTYNKPGTNIIVMGLPDTALAAAPNKNAPNLNISFTKGGLASASLNPDIAVRISTANGVNYPVTRVAGTTLGINKDTGSFSGGFILLDSTIKRSVTYQGLLIPPIPHTPATYSSGVLTANEIPGSSGFGTGYFLLPELLPTTSKSKINSGRVVIQGMPIVIDTHPASQTVNPGASVSMSVSVTAGYQGTLTYRWRKAGNTVSGATTSTLNLGTVAEASQGNYDCVISNGSFSVTSSQATLSVNDPVTEVAITRSPSASAVATGTKVTFTATAKGTGPLQYQWKKGTEEILNATSSTYEIASVTPADTGSYTVVVKNGVTTTGASPATPNALTVADLVVITQVSRSPVDQTVPTGTEVTFSVTATGTGPFTYQWKKGTSTITGATASSYTIPSASTADNGDYTVIVKGVLPAAGVTSTAVPLAVAAP